MFTDCNNPFFNRMFEMRFTTALIQFIVYHQSICSVKTGNIHTDFSIDRFKILIRICVSCGIYRIFQNSLYCVS